MGTALTPATASHTFKLGKYKCTVSDSQYNKLKKAKKNGEIYGVDVKGDGKIKVKVPNYKTKKVKKWKYKNVVTRKTVYNSDFSDCTYHDYDYKYQQMINKGWKYYGYKITKSSNGRVVKTVDKFKKKTTVKKKVRSGYKYVGKSYYMTISSDGDCSVYLKYNDKELKTGHVNI
jgi:hypothetical protein